MATQNKRPTQQVNTKFTQDKKSAKTIRSDRAVLAEVETLLSIQTAPGAVCFLSHEQATGRSLQLDADDLGIVRFHVMAANEAKPVEFRLDFKGKDGKKIRHLIRLITGTQNVNINDAPESAAVGELRRPLRGDLLAHSNQDLVKRGYPPRPDPKVSPARYARWLRIVSRPFTVVNPRKVAHPDIVFARMHTPPVLQSPTLPLPPPISRAIFNANANAWSGALYRFPAAQYFQIQGDWNVPAVRARRDAPFYSAAAEWVGLDNNTTDIFQAGSNSECVDFSPFGHRWVVTHYWMWIEALPFAPSHLSNLPISPGDAVSVDIFVADQNGQTWFANGTSGALTPANNSVWFMMYNHTQGASYWATLPTAATTFQGTSDSGFTGTTAEFIIERPGDGKGGAYPLAYFNSASMHGCWVGDSANGHSLTPLGPNGTSSPSSTLLYVNMVNPADNNLLAVAIDSPDPTSPEGSEIIWYWGGYS
ncbi:MAG: G1 family endopeptidase [Planctomycetota bacterium]|nr:G1 family endopeptidase [Planctomycetota bacterium]